MIDVVEFARQILSMQREINDLRRENARLEGFEQKYNDLVVEQIRHSEKLMGGLLTVGLKLAAATPKEPLGQLRQAVEQRRTLRSPPPFDVDGDTLRTLLVAEGWTVVEPLHGGAKDGLYVLEHAAHPGRQLAFPRTTDAPDFAEAVERVLYRLVELS